MPRSGPKIELRKLLRFVREVEARFLSGHIQPTHLGPPTREETLDVAAFVVLTHGALENYIEGVTLWLAERIESSWVKRKRATRSTVSVLLRMNRKIDDETNTSNAYDTIRSALEDAKSERSKAANANNGIALKHIRLLLAPLGVDVPSDPLLVASLDSLVAMRHEWAHQSRFGGAHTPKTAADVKKTADDCLALARQIASAIAALRL